MILKKRKRTAGFTLLELLIVVIVIGILAAVVLPQLQEMGRRARAAEAVNAIDSLLTAEWIYFHENNRFSAVITPLGVAIDETNFAYTGMLSPDSVAWIAGGVANTPYVGIQVVGRIRRNGVRTIYPPTGL